MRNEGPCSEYYLQQTPNNNILLYSTELAKILFLNI